MRIEISHEEELLDTGGGLKKAAWFFLEGKSPGSELAPFWVHNVDMVSTIDLTVMAQFHAAQGALATLAVQDRTTSRYLLFDEQGMLCGRRRGTTAHLRWRELHGAAGAGVFGIHVVSPRIFGMMTETGAFSIFDTYLRLAAQGEKIVAFRADGMYWRDLGTPERVEAAARETRAAS